MIERHYGHLVMHARARTAREGHFCEGDSGKTARPWDPRARLWRRRRKRVHCLGPHDQSRCAWRASSEPKRDVFDRYRRKGLVAKDEACIIAINSREIPHAWADAKEFLYRTSLRSGKPVPPHRCIVASRPLVVSIGRYWSL